MVSHNIASKQANKEEEQSMDGGGSGRNTSTLRPPEQILKCPRCDSSNTKFCYYNNYSLAQPRHFCKTCKRYWTKGGALRNVPIGGNCRKNKRAKSCSLKCSSLDIGGTKFFGLSTLDFHLGGLNLPPKVTNQFSSTYGDNSSNHSIVNLDPLGYNLPFSSSHSHNIVNMKHNQNEGELRSFHHNNDLASSIVSLSSINQDLHWKLQQQRLSMLSGGGTDGDDHQQPKQQVVLEPHNQKLQPVLFQNLETSKPAQSSMDGDHSTKESVDGCGLAPGWFFDSSYHAAASTNSNDPANDENGSMTNWNGIQSWKQ